MAEMDDYMAEFSGICQKLDNGRDVCNLMTGFWKSLAKIEQAYAKQLSDLCSGRFGCLQRLFGSGGALFGGAEAVAPGSLEHIGSLQDCWLKVTSEVEKLAEEHKQLGQHIVKKVTPAIEKFTKEKMVEQGQAVANGKRFLGEVRSDLQRVTITKRKYFAEVAARRDRGEEVVKGGEQTPVELAYRAAVTDASSRYTQSEDLLSHTRVTQLLVPSRQWKKQRRAYAKRLAQANFIKRIALNLWPPDSSFHFSTGYLCAISIGLVGISIIYSYTMFSFGSGLSSLEETFKDFEDIDKLFRIMKGFLFFGFTLALFFTVGSVPFAMAKYRHDTINLFRGKRKPLPKLGAPLDQGQAFVKFVGYQGAFLMAGFAWLMILLGLALLLVSFVIWYTAFVSTVLLERIALFIAAPVTSAITFLIIMRIVVVMKFIPKEDKEEKEDDPEDEEEGGDSLGKVRSSALSQRTSIRSSEKEDEEEEGEEVKAAKKAEDPEDNTIEKEDEDGRNPATEEEEEEEEGEDDDDEEEDTEEEEGEKGKKGVLQGLTAFRNVRGLFFFSYLMVFYFMMLGIISAIVRIGLTAGVNFLRVARLDSPCTPREWLFIDSGHKLYSNYLQVEVGHSHPVMIAFLDALRACVKKPVNEEEAETDQDEERSVGGRQLLSLQETERWSERRARRRWWLFYTLVRNTELVKLRRHGELPSPSCKTKKKCCRQLAASVCKKGCKCKRKPSQLSHPESSQMSREEDRRSFDDTDKLIKQ